MRARPAPTLAALAALALAVTLAWPALAGAAARPGPSRVPRVKHVGHQVDGRFGAVERFAADSARVVPCLRPAPAGAPRLVCAQVALRLRVRRGGGLQGLSQLVHVSQHTPAELRRELGDQARRAMRAVVAALVEAMRAAGEAGARDRKLALARLIDALDGAPHYRVQPGVTLGHYAELHLERLARAFARRTRALLLVTSGTRTPWRQARAMYVKLLLRDNLLKLYRRRDLLLEVLRAYRSGYSWQRTRVRRRGKRERRRRRWRRLRVRSLTHAEIIGRMRDVIAAQVKRGEYLSPHLRAGAVDLRSRTLPRWQRRVLMRIARQLPGVSWAKLEKRPPHLHVTFGPTDRPSAWQRRWALRYGSGVARWAALRPRRRRRRRRGRRRGRRRRRPRRSRRGL